MDGVLAAEARRLRTEEQLSARQIQQRLGVTKSQLYEWLRGVPVPEWTRRPNAKDALRARAEELRGIGWSVNDIALELGVAKSTAWRWVRHLPLDRDSDHARRKREHSVLMTNSRWAAHRAERDRRRAELQTAAVTEVGELTARDLLLLGAAMYWCEGTKPKPWRPHGFGFYFTNSDPWLLEVFLRFLEVNGVARAAVRYRVSIHESADPAAAERWWAQRLGLLLSWFQRATLKRHRASTNRHNTGDQYHGCLVVYVPRGRELYWRIEGVMRGIAGECSA